MDGYGLKSVGLVLAGVVAATGCAEAELDGEQRAFPAIEAARAAARRQANLNAMKQIALAVLNYESAYGRLPPNSAPLIPNGTEYGWRVHILPFMEDQGLYDQILSLEELGRGDELEALLEITPPIYRDAANESLIDALWGPGYTNVLGAVGPNAAFAGPVGEQGWQLTGVVDGSSNTIFAVMAPPSKATPWSAPDELIDPSRASWLEGIEVAEDEHGHRGVDSHSWLYAAYLDGHVDIVDPEMDRALLRSQFIIDDGAAWVPDPWAIFDEDNDVLGGWITDQWQAIADMTVPASLDALLTRDGHQVWNYPDGNGTTRADFHAGVLALPPGKTPESLLEDLANDINGTTGDGALRNWVVWPAAAERKLGDQVDLDIAGPDNGAVGYVDFGPNRFCVITLQNDSVGVHPVNGIRCWGYVPIAIKAQWTATSAEAARWAGAGQTYMVYTMGIDSPSVPGAGGPGAILQQATWNALISDLLKENESSGGVSGRWYQQVTRPQPNTLAPGAGVSVNSAGDRDVHYVDLP